MWPMILKICIIISGSVLILVDLLSYFRKKINEKLAAMWIVCGVAMILSGVVPVLYDWSYLMCDTGYIALIIFLAIILMVIYKMAKDISVLRQKNQELAMQVSLLNQENHIILSKLDSITGESKNNK